MTRRRSLGKRLAFVVTTSVAVLAFLGAGIGNLVRSEHMVEDMTQLGYPLYFMTILGTWKVLGALAVAAPKLPRLKEWAYAGMLFDLTGAAISRAAVGHEITTIAPPLVVAVAVAASWALRPPSRRLERART